jgi:AcrR family transcriptional regulator
VAKGTYYLYFKDKRAVLEELVDGLFARLGGAIVRVDVAGEVRPQVEHNIRAIVAVFLADPALTRLLLSYAAGLDPAFVQKIGSFYESARSMLSTALEEGQRLGIVGPGSPDFFATVTLGMIKEVLQEASNPERARPREDIVRDIFDFLQGGYLRVPAVSSLTPAPGGAGPARARKR